jgi:hypothetical protein
MEEPKVGTRRAMSPAPSRRPWARLAHRAYPAGRAPSNSATGRDAVAARPSSGVKASTRVPRGGIASAGGTRPEHGRPEEVFPVHRHLYSGVPEQPEPTAVIPEQRGVRTANPEQRAPEAVHPEQVDPAEPNGQPDDDGVGAPTADEHRVVEVVVAPAPDRVVKVVVAPAPDRVVEVVVAPAPDRVVEGVVAPAGSSRRSSGRPGVGSCRRSTDPRAACARSQHPGTTGAADGDLRSARTAKPGGRAARTAQGGHANPGAGEPRRCEPRTTRDGRGCGGW